MEIESLIAKSRVSLETRKILPARTSALFPSLAKKSYRKQKLQPTKEEPNSLQNQTNPKDKPEKKFNK